MKLFIPIIFLIGAASALPTKAGVVPNTPENIYRLKHLKKGESPWEFSGQFEGDIVLTEKQLATLESRNGVGYDNEKWPNKTVPYLMTGPYTNNQKSFIKEKLDQLENYSCIKFVPRTNEVDYVDITSTDSGCFTTVGRRGGRQQLNLAEECLTHGAVLHELNHVIGFWHMHRHTNRDDYVTVVWENIQSGKEENFRKFSATRDYGIGYDYNSLMHYGRTAFSVNGKATLIPKDPNADIGQTIGFSRRDVEKINRMYDCPL